MNWSPPKPLEPSPFTQNEKPAAWSHSGLPRSGVVTKVPFSPSNVNFTALPNLPSTISECAPLSGSRSLRSSMEWISVASWTQKRGTAARRARRFMGGPYQGKGEPAPVPTLVPPVAVFGCVNLSGESAIDEDEVADHREDARDPPGQGRAEAFRRRRGVVDGEAPRRVGARREHRRVEAEGHREHHPGEEQGRGEERGGVPLLPAQPDAEPDRDRREQRERVAGNLDRVLPEEEGALLLDEAGPDRRRQAQHEGRPRRDRRGAARPVLHGADGLLHDPQRAVMRERGRRGQPREHRIAVEDAAARAGFERRPEGLEEAPVLPDRHPADHVAERDAEEEREQAARQREDRVPESRPGGVVELVAQLDAERAAAEQPEDDHERE